MKPAYLVIITILAIAMAYMAGIGYGRRHTGDAWHSAVLAVPDDACRYAVRDQLKLIGSHDRPTR